MGKAGSYREKDNYNSILTVAFGFILCLIAFTAAKLIFEVEFTYFFKWWLTITVMGVAFLPLSALIFSRFSDMGWMFSKVIGIAVSGWLVWYLSSLKIFKFTRISCIVILSVCFVPV